MSDLCFSTRSVASCGRSADTVKTVNFVPSEECLRTVSPGLVSTVVIDLRNRRNHGVIIRQCLPCEIQAFHYVFLFSVFLFHGFTAKVNAGVECHNKFSPGFFFFFF